MERERSTCKSSKEALFQYGTSGKKKTWYSILSIGGSVAWTESETQQSLAIEERQVDFLWIGAVRDIGLRIDLKKKTDKIDVALLSNGVPYKMNVLHNVLIRAAVEWDMIWVAHIDWHIVHP